MDNRIGITAKFRPGNIAESKNTDELRITAWYA
jgi:hypothetical protein